MIDLSMIYRVECWVFVPIFSMVNTLSCLVSHENEK